MNVEYREGVEAGVYPVREVKVGWIWHVDYSQPGPSGGFKIREVSSSTITNMAGRPVEYIYWFLEDNTHGRWSDPDGRYANILQSPGVHLNIEDET